MKRICALCLLALLALAGCDTQPAVSELSRSSVAGQQEPEAGEPALGERAPVSGGQSESEPDDVDMGALLGIPTLPDFEQMPLKESPFDVDDLYGDVQELAYTATAPGAGFLQALAELDDETFRSYTGPFEFAEIGEYLVYPVMDSDWGPYKVLVESPDGSTKVILDSLYGVRSISFLDRGTMTVEFSTWQHYDAGSGAYYSFDLAAGTVIPSQLGETDGDHWYDYATYESYGGRLYKFEGDDRPGDVGYAYDVSLQDQSGNFEKVLEELPWYQFSGDKLYFVDALRTHLYAADLEGKNAELVYTFANSPISTFTLCGNWIYYKLQYEAGAGQFLANIESGEEITLEDGLDMLLLTAEGYYARSDDNVLFFIGFLQRKTPLIAGYNEQFELLGARGGNIYFRTAHHLNPVNRYAYWRIQKDGTGLIQLNA